MITKKWRCWLTVGFGIAILIFSFWFSWGFLATHFSNNQKKSTEVNGMWIPLLDEAAKYAGGSGIVMRGENRVYQWGDIEKLHDLKSTTKSIGVTVLGLAIKDGLVDLNDRVIQQYPSVGNPPQQNVETHWIDKITYLHLATHTAGFDKPGGYNLLLHKPGSAWAYSDGGANWLADALTHLYRMDLKELLFDRVFNKIGIKRRDLTWRENRYRERQLNGIPRREFGSGIHANIKAMAQIGLLYLRRGKWQGWEILSNEFVDIVRKPVDFVSRLPVKNDLQKIFKEASRHHGLLWWNNGDKTLKEVPEDAFWAWGLGDSLIVVIPSLDIVVTRVGKPIKGKREPSAYRILEPFLQPIVAAVNYGTSYPNSPVISNLSWDKSSNIFRKALGGDNWPVTWAEDNRIYTAYGDGNGFKPKLEKKVSLGFARIEGIPPNFSGYNLKSDGVQFGNGQSGKKASGLLMVDGVLYMWVRNANKDNEGSQLAWSTDLGKTWKWNNWVFDQFGYCTFINFGRNYQGARDSYIYSVTHDHPSAYKRADRFILMRVPINDVLKRDAYEFFKGFSKEKKPLWTNNIKERGAVFRDPGRCFRSGISYNPFLRRYFWWQAKFTEKIDGRHESSSFAVFDAPEPWGQWTTSYYTEKWDVNTGETGSFPTKWMNGESKTMFLIFSGNDSFSVRKVKITISPDAVNR